MGIHAALPKGHGQASNAPDMGLHLDLDHLAVLVQCRGGQVGEPAGWTAFLHVRQITLVVNDGKIPSLGATMPRTARLLATPALRWSVFCAVLFRFDRAVLLALIPAQSVLQVFDPGILEQDLLS
jgi:hypothetical protein